MCKKARRRLNASKGREAPSASPATAAHPCPPPPAELISLYDFRPAFAAFSHAIHTAPAAPEAGGPPPPRRAAILDGRAVAAAWQDELAGQVADVRARGGRPPGLGVILVGDRPDSLLYVTRKREACDRVGIRSVVSHLPADTSQVGLRRAVRALCADPAIDGVLVQLPLPGHIDEEDVIEHFDPGKDVDGFHPLNVGRTLMRGRCARFVPCTALGCVELLRRSGVPIAGRSVAIVGDSNIVGMPLAMLFRDEGAATVSVVHRSSYSSLFSGGAAAAGAGAATAAQRRADANACLPHRPGPDMYDYQARDAAASAPAGGDRPTNHHADSRAQHHREAQPYQVTYSSGMRDAYLPPPPHGEDPAAVPAHLSELAGITRTADILVVAVGYPHLIKADWIKPGAVVIDVGINAVDWDVPPGAAAAEVGGPGRAGRGVSEDQEDHPPFHVTGDVDFEEAVRVASAVSPVPGGVGPMTIAALLHNTVHAAAIKMGLRSEGARQNTPPPPEAALSD